MSASKAAEARIAEMLFPPADKPWLMGGTPGPHDDNAALANALQAARVEGLKQDVRDDVSKIKKLREEGNLDAAWAAADRLAASLEALREV